MQLYFWEQATAQTAACYVYVARLCSSVVPWLPSLILWLRKIGESSIDWNRSLRAKTQGGVSGGQILYFL